MNKQKRHRNNFQQNRIPYNKPNMDTLTEEDSRKAEKSKQRRQKWENYQFLKVSGSKNENITPEAMFKS